MKDFFEEELKNEFRRIIRCYARATSAVRHLVGFCFESKLKERDAAFIDRIGHLDDRFSSGGQYFELTQSTDCPSHCGFSEGKIIEL